LAEEIVVFRDVRKTFRIRNRSDALRDAIPRLLGRLVGRASSGPAPFVALDGVSFAARRGEAVGVVGANGAGKSTALRLAAAVYRPDAGSVEVKGRVAAMIELGAGFHPDLSGRENIYLVGALLGLRRRDIEVVFDRIVGFADIGEFLDSPVRVYSSGMAVRLGFAVAAHVPAEVLLVDEVLAVGDMDFQAKCLQRMAERRQEGVSILFVSHNLTIVQQFCDRVVLLHHGKVIADGEPSDAIGTYRRKMAEEHPEKEDRAGGRWNWSPRHGTGEVRLEGVRVEGDEGLPAGCARSGGRLRISASWKAASSYENPVFGVAVYSPDGALCAEATTLASPPGRVEGTGQMAVEIPELSLLPGDYEVSVFAKDRDGLMPLDVHQRIYPLTVVGDAPPGERGFVSLRPVWSVSRNGG